ncbi:hypothetical protein TW95_gp0262 [Pandoravirus inopinatum]|uniref:Uncharacterized protein n=1 Tax=Pandoravirus inopinatum TaxID=1605721 RepID=A0A0B5J881_9VIRU|nr:hypothetical protein TW95_gp0262 [Pandoravirus inopinatum]AJF96996.1 hypothetical protein [Pandoravirus inopinatum]
MWPFGKGKTLGGPCRWFVFFQTKKEEGTNAATAQSPASVGPPAAYKNRKGHQTKKVLNRHNIHTTGLTLSHNPPTMTSTFFSNPADVPAEATADAKPTLTLGAFWEAVSAMPKDAPVCRIKLAPAFVVPKQSYLETGPLASLDKIDPDAFEGAAAITVYEDRHTFGPASVVAAQIEPLLGRHSHRRLVSGGDAVTGLLTTTRLATGKPLTADHLCPDSAVTSETIIRATEALARTTKVDDTSIVAAMEPALPDGIHVCLYRVGDRVFDTAAFKTTFPRLTTQERRDIFTRVDRPAGARTGVYGRLSMWSAPADITYEMLVAAFGPTQSALDRLRNIAACAGAVPTARDPACPQ